MGIQDFNSLIRNGLAYSKSEPIMNETGATTSQGSTALGVQRVGVTRVIETLPSGIVSVIPTTIDIASSAAGIAPVLVGRITNLGSLDISGASGTFTAGSPMPTRRVLGVNQSTYSAVIVEVTTALNATPGNYTMTYVDQDGNSAETTSVLALAASSVVGSAHIAILNGNDNAVREVTAATRTSGTTPTGVITFYGIEPLTMMMPSVGIVSNFQEDLVVSQTNMMELVAGDVIAFYMINTLTAKSVLGRISYVGNN